MRTLAYCSVVFWLTESDLLTADRNVCSLMHFLRRPWASRKVLYRGYVKVFIDQLSSRAASGSLDLVNWFNFISKWLDRVPIILANSSDG